MQFKVPKRIWLAFEFTFGVVLSALVALVVFVGASALTVALRWLERVFSAPEWLVTGTDYLEIGAWVIDSVLWTLFIGTDALKFARALLSASED